MNEEKTYKILGHQFRVTDKTQPKGRPKVEVFSVNSKANKLPIDLLGSRVLDEVERRIPGKGDLVIEGMGIHAAYSGAAIALHKKNLPEILSIKYAITFSERPRNIVMGIGKMFGPSNIKRGEALFRSTCLVMDEIRADKTFLAGVHAEAILLDTTIRNNTEEAARLADLDRRFASEQLEGPLLDKLKSLYPGNPDDFNGDPVLAKFVDEIVKAIIDHEFDQPLRHRPRPPGPGSGGRE